MKLIDFSVPYIEKNMFETCSLHLRLIKGIVQLNDLTPVIAHEASNLAAIARVVFQFFN